MTSQAIRGQAFHEAAANLGALRGRFASGNKPLLAILGIVVLLLAALIGSAYFTTDPKEMDRDPMLTFALIFGALGAYILWLWFTRRGKTVEVYEQGLARIRGKLVKVTRWDDISAVWQQITRHYRSGLHVNTTYVYTIQAKNGERFTVSNEYKDIESLGQIIQSEVTQRLLPSILRAYQNGQTVNFGKLSLNTQGLIYNNKQLPWNQIQDLKIDRGYISVKQEGGRWFNWAQVSAGSVPNLIVFLALVDSIIGIRSGR